MAERTAFEMLTDYCKDNGFVFETHESQRNFYLFPGDPVLKTKYLIFKKDSIFFCAFDSYAVKAYMNKTFTGIYSLIHLPEEFECKIREKDWLDFFLTMNKKKTGNDSIDRKITISTWSEQIPAGLISEKEVWSLVEINHRISPVELIIQNDYLSVIREFNGKKIIGLETSQWLYQKDDLDVFISKGAKLIKNITG
jgi:hypothetical protein